MVLQADKRRCFAKHKKRQKVEMAIGATAANVGKVRTPVISSNRSEWRV